MPNLFEKLLGWTAKKALGSAKVVQLPSASASGASLGRGVNSCALTRPGVRSFALAASKLRPVVSGTANPRIARALRWRPNELETTSQFIAHVATILKVCSCAFIFPVKDRIGRVSGYMPVVPSTASAWMDRESGDVWVDATMPDGSRMTVPIKEIGILKTDVLMNAAFGDGNHPAVPLIEQATSTVGSVVSAISNSARILYIAKANGIVSDDDLEKTRDRFAKSMLSDGNDTPLAIYDQKLDALERVEPRDFVADAKQMDIVLRQVYDYMGTNEAILQRSWNEEQWTAYYEGEIEPFAIQLSEVLTTMTFTDIEISNGNAVEFRADRLQYATTASLTNLVSAMVDRGVMSLERARYLVGEDGDAGGTYVIRGEYVGIDGLGRLVEGNDGGATPREEEGGEQNGR